MLAFNLGRFKFDTTMTTLQTKKKRNKSKDPLGRC